MHITVGTTSATEIEALLARVEAVVDEPWFSRRFKVVDVSDTTRAHLTADLARRIERVLQAARFERDAADIETALGVAAGDARTGAPYCRDSTTLGVRGGHRSGHHGAGDGAAEAVVGLGPDADADAIDAAVAEVMEFREITDAIVGDLGWSVSTPLEEARADARARAAVATLASALRLDLNPALADTLKTAPRQEQRDGWGRGRSGSGRDDLTPSVGCLSCIGDQSKRHSEPV